MSEHRVIVPIPKQLRIVSEEEWHTDLERLVGQVGKREEAQRKGVPVGTITTWLAVPARRIELARLEQIPLPLPEDTIRMRNLRLTLRFSPTLARQNQIVAQIEQYQKITYHWYIDYDPQNPNRPKIHATAAITGYVRDSWLTEKKDILESYLAAILREQVLASSKEHPYYKRINGIWIFQGEGSRSPFLSFMFFNNIGIYGLNVLGIKSDKYHDTWLFEGYAENEKHDEAYKWEFNFTVMESRFRIGS